MGLVFHCMKCRASTPELDYEVTTTSNGRKMGRSKCPRCGTTVVKFLKG